MEGEAKGCFETLQSMKYNFASIVLIKVFNKIIVSTVKMQYCLHAQSLQCQKTWSCPAYKLLQS